MYKLKIFVQEVLEHKTFNLNQRTEKKVQYVETGFLNKEKNNKF